MQKCLGKYWFHDWGKWERYQMNKAYLRVESYEKNTIPFTETRQKRICKRCGYFQDKKIIGITEI